MSNNVVNKHLQCLQNETNFYSVEPEQQYPLLQLVIIICTNVGLLFLLSKLFKNRKSSKDSSVIEESILIQTAPPCKFCFISLSCPPELFWYNSEQNSKTLTVRNLERVVLDEDEAEGERLRDYKPGGYMPCEPGQLLGPNRNYIILRKLGWGHFSTVWMCENLEVAKYEAVKIIKSDKMYINVAQDEISLLELIRKKNPKHEGYDKIVILRNHFSEKSSCGGVHMCLSFDVMGPTLYELLVQNHFKGFLQDGVKAIIKQILKALTYLHEECQVIHTDIKPENVLVTVNAKYIQEMVDMAHHFSEAGVHMPKSYVSTLLWKDHIKAYGDPCGSNSFVSIISNSTATHDDSAINASKTSKEQSTKHIFPLPIFVDRNIQVKLADLGNACLQKHQYSHTIQTVQYRALEVLLQAGYSYPADLWSVACVAFELSTGEYLFNPQESRTLSVTEDHLGLIWEVLNGIPNYIAMGGLVSTEYFNSEGYLKCIPVKNLKIWKVEDVLVEKYKWRRVDAILLGNFIQLLIEPDPQLRATASSALEVEWLKE